MSEVNKELTDEDRKLFYDFKELEVTTDNFKIQNGPDKIKPDMFIDAWIKTRKIIKEENNCFEPQTFPSHLLKTLLGSANAQDVFQSINKNAEDFFTKLCAKLKAGQKSGGQRPTIKVPATVAKTVTSPKRLATRKSPGVKSPKKGAVRQVRQNTIL